MGAAMPPQEEDPSDYLNRLAKHPRLSRPTVPTRVPSMLEHMGGGGERVKQPRPLEDGNWICDESTCGNVNYPRRTEVAATQPTSSAYTSLSVHSGSYLHTISGECADDIYQIAQCNKCGRRRGPVGDAVVKAYVNTIKMHRGELPSNPLRPEVAEHLMPGMGPSISQHREVGSSMLPEYERWMGGGYDGQPTVDSEGLLPYHQHKYSLQHQQPPVAAQQQQQQQQHYMLSGHGMPGSDMNYFSNRSPMTCATQPPHSGPSFRRIHALSRTSAEGKKVAEQLVAVFAASADPIADAGECLAAAALWLQSMRYSLQVQAQAAASHHLVGAGPSGRPSSSSSGHPIVSLRHSPSHSQTGMGSGVDGAMYGGSRDAGASSLRGHQYTERQGNSQQYKTASMGSMGRGSTSYGAGLGDTGSSSLGGGATSSPLGHDHQLLGSSNLVGHGVGRMSGTGSPYSINKSSSGLQPVSMIGTKGHPGGPLLGSGQSRMMMHRTVTFEDYHDRPSDYLREFGDPAAMNATSGGNHRPEAGVDGNWACEDCKNVNFPRRTSCFQCHRKRSARGDEIVREYVRQLIEESQRIRV
eukprot:SM000104S09351  [mRNA]  locus=s104:196331:199501:- [translate_table: standard]